MESKLGSDTSIDVSYVGSDRYRSAAVDRRASGLEQSGVECLVELVVLPGGVPAGLAIEERRDIQDRRQIESVGLLVIDRVLKVERFGLTDRLGEGSEAKFGQELANLFGNELKEIHHELGRSSELLA